MDHLGFVLRETDDWTNQGSFIGEKMTDQLGSFLREVMTVILALASAVRHSFGLAK